VRSHTHTTSLGLIVGIACATIALELASGSASALPNTPHHIVVVTGTPAGPATRELAIPPSWQLPGRGTQPVFVTTVGGEQGSGKSVFLTALGKALAVPRATFKSGCSTQHETRGMWASDPSSPGPSGQGSSKSVSQSGVLLVDVEGQDLSNPGDDEALMGYSANTDLHIQLFQRTFTRGQLGSLATSAYRRCTINPANKATLVVLLRTRRVIQCKNKVACPVNQLLQEFLDDNQLAGTVQAAFPDRYVFVVPEVGCTRVGT
jgi:hypothetical protein